MKLWHLGNTTVRSPFRLREALIALSESPLQGNLHGGEQEVAFRNLLGERGIVSLGQDETNSVGRKWRSALMQLGFIYGEDQFDSVGLSLIDKITPNGKRLVEADSVPGMQECFLRSLAAYCIPSVVEDGYGCQPFSPLKYTLRIMLSLEKRGLDTLSFQEMGLFVQSSTPESGIEKVVTQIVEHRKTRDESENKRRYDSMQVEEMVRAYDYRPQTFRDYADVNFRYLRATGLFISKGRSLAINPERRLFIEKLLNIPDYPGDAEYLAVLTMGAVLPTDNQDEASLVLHDLVRQLQELGQSFDLSGRNLSSPADIAIVRHEIEQQIANIKEENYAHSQADSWQDIIAYLDRINQRRPVVPVEEGEDVSIPRMEYPAYLEWALWRSFLAINKLVNKPYNSRRFKIDQDFLPVGTAPGNGPDLIFEFEEYVLVVEATLMSGSRQEAAEGEPVRRHVAQSLEQYHGVKPVLGLFIANKIDSNTAETFRIGSWYTGTDAKLDLTIVPLTIDQFRSFFENLFTRNRVDNKNVLALLNECAMYRHDLPAPQWKERIQQIVDTAIA
jgi:hypothetical protein